MFDVTSSKLLILGVVALIVIGPKDLPALLRTLGKYMAMIRRQANEFRAQFEEAMRESELAELKQQVESVGREAETTFDAAGRSLTNEVNAAASVLEADRDTKAVAPPAVDAGGPQAAQEGEATPAAVGEPAKADAGNVEPVEKSGA
jgi:sec-independent protein translocase protein TatB